MLIVGGGTKGRLRDVLPGVVFNCELVVVCGCVYHWVTDGPVSCHDGDSHIASV